MKCTISAMTGDGVTAHNRRTYIAENVDAERTHLNVEYCYTPIRQVYHELFDEALAEYNAKQTRQDRVIENYYEKIVYSKQEKPFYEVIFQIGNKDDMSATGENAELARTMLGQFMRDFQARNPNLRVFSAHLHMDEATPHLHIDFVPFTTGSKRGLSTRASLKKALAAQGIKGEGRSNTERAVWIQREKEHLAEIMREHGIEWEQKGEHREHLDVLAYKKEQRAKEVAELEQAQTGCLCARQTGVWFSHCHFPTQFADTCCLHISLLPLDFCLAVCRRVWYTQRVAANEGRSRREKACGCLAEGRGETFRYGLLSIASGTR